MLDTHSLATYPVSMVVVKQKVENDLEIAINTAVMELGGWAKYINKGDVVFLKPNCNTADPFPASTDLEFLKVVVELCYKAGAKAVLVGDSSTFTLNTRKVFDQKGIFSLQDLPDPARIYVFEEGKWLTKTIPMGKYLTKASLPEIVFRADKMIWLPCCKTHKQAQYTGALKLAVGLLKPIQRVPMHLRNLQEKVAELNSLIQPNLVIMDARKIFIRGGPSSGEIREPNLILASESRVEIDIEGIKLIQSFPGNSLAGIKAEELTQIKFTRKMGIK